MVLALFATAAALCAATLVAAMALGAAAGTSRRPWGEQSKVVHRAVDIGGALAGIAFAVALLEALTR